MELIIGSNFDSKLVEGLADVPEVREFMAALPLQAVGTDRPPAKHPTATRDEVAQHVRLVHDVGRTINFLLNAPSLGGREFEPGRRARVLDYVAWLEGIGVDAVSVCSPALLELIRARFPRLQVHISHNAGIASPAQIRCLQDLGASAICFLRCLNHSIPVLAAACRAATVPLQLTCLSVCLPGCPMKVSQYHLSITTTLCTEGHVTDAHARHGHVGNVAWCHIYRLNAAQELLKGCYLRPEDLPLIEKHTGIRQFKLDTRGHTTAAAVATVKAYAAARYDGDLKKLLNVFHLIGFRNPAGPPVPTGPVEFLTDGQIVDAMFNIAARVDFDKVLAYDNRGLDGYFEELVREPCPPVCADCDRCTTYAARAMKWDEGLRKEVVDIILRYRDWLLNR